VKGKQSLAVEYTTFVGRPNNGNNFLGTPLHIHTVCEP